VPIAALSRWPFFRRWFGDRSERAAERLLLGLGHRIVGRNYSCRAGEIDIVSVDGRCLVFSEVRSTASTDTLRVELSITPEKQRRLTQAALHFLQRHHFKDQLCRFDVLIVSWVAGAEAPTITHHASAFDAIGRFQMDY